MKTPHLALALLAFPLTLAAQQPPAGPPTDPITTSFRGRILNLHRNLAQAFDSVPESKFSYKPTPAQLTIGYIAQHLANDNYLFCSRFGEMKPSRPDNEASTPDSVKATWPKAELVAQLKASFQFCQSALQQVNDGTLADQVPIQGPNNTTRNVTRAAMLLGHAMDLADHYSQMANYMRLNGMLPPTALPRPRPGGN